MMRRRLSCLLACMWAHACALACKRGRLAQSPILGERAPPFFGETKRDITQTTQRPFPSFFLLVLCLDIVVGCSCCWLFVFVFVCLFVFVCVCVSIPSGGTIFRFLFPILPTTVRYIYTPIYIYIQDIQSFCHYSFIHLLGVRRWRLCVSKKRLCGVFSHRSCLQRSFFGRRVHRHEHTNNHDLIELVGKERGHQNFGENTHTHTKEWISSTRKDLFIFH